MAKASRKTAFEGKSKTTTEKKKPTTKTQNKQKTPSNQRKSSPAPNHRCPYSLPSQGKKRKAESNEKRPKPNVASSSPTISPSGFVGRFCFPSENCDLGFSVCGCCCHGIYWWVSVCVYALSCSFSRFLSGGGGQRGDRATEVTPMGF